MYKLQMTVTHCITKHHGFLLLLFILILYHFFIQHKGYSTIKHTAGRMQITLTLCIKLDQKQLCIDRCRRASWWQLVGW